MSAGPRAERWRLTPWLVLGLVSVIFSEALGVGLDALWLVPAATVTALLVVALLLAGVARRRRALEDRRRAAHGAAVSSGREGPGARRA